MGGPILNLPRASANGSPPGCPRAVGPAVPSVGGGCSCCSCAWQQAETRSCRFGQAESRGNFGPRAERMTHFCLPATYPIS
eukprot:4521572-Prymnesium_polylepis.2